MTEKKIQIDGIEYLIEYNLGVSMIYEELTGNPWITGRKLKQKDIYMLIYSVFKANNEHFNSDFRYFVNKTLTKNPWIISEVTDILFAKPQQEPKGEKKSL